MYPGNYRMRDELTGSDDRTDDHHYNKNSAEYLNRILEEKNEQ